MRLVFCGLDSSLLGAGVFVARVLCFLAVVCVSPVRAGSWYVAREYPALAGD